MPFQMSFHKNGDKIILPASILDTLIEMDVEYPFTFELITNQNKTHCGVLEFTADEEMCFIPQWIMNNLELKDGNIVYIRNVALQKATFIKFKPESKFFELSNPRATLEYILRSFSCVTIGDKLHFDYNEKEYILEIVDVKPKKASCIIEADIEVEFDEPVCEPDDVCELDDVCEPESDNYTPDVKIDKSEIHKSELDKSPERVESHKNTSTKWGKLSKMAHFQGDGNKL